MLKFLRGIVEAFAFVILVMIAVVVVRCGRRDETERTLRLVVSCPEPDAGPQGPVPPTSP